MGGKIFHELLVESLRNLRKHDSALGLVMEFPDSFKEFSRPIEKVARLPIGPSLILEEVCVE